MKNQNTLLIIIAILLIAFKVNLPNTEPNKKTQNLTF